MPIGFGRGWIISMAVSSRSTRAIVRSCVAATIDSGSGPQNAGTLNADITLAGLFDDKGAVAAPGETDFQVCRTADSIKEQRRDIKVKSSGIVSSHLDTQVGC